MFQQSIILDVLKKSKVRIINIIIHNYKLQNDHLMVGLSMSYEMKWKLQRINKEILIL